MSQTLIKTKDYIIVYQLCSYLNILEWESQKEFLMKTYFQFYSDQVAVLRRGIFLVFSVKSPAGISLLLSPLFSEFFNARLLNFTVVEISKYFILLATQKNLQYMYKKRVFHVCELYSLLITEFIFQ